MNTTEQEWNKLIDDWQQSKPSLKATPNQSEQRYLKTLSNKVIKDGKNERIGIVFSVAISLIVCIYLFNEIHLGLPSKFDYALYCSMLILVLMTGISIVWHQRGMWKTHAEQSKQYIELMLRQNLAASRVSKVGEIFGYGLLLTFYGIVVWIMLPSLLAGTLMEDLSSIAKPVLGSIILLSATVIGLAAIFFNRKLQRSLSKKGDMLQTLIKDFQ